MKTIGLTGGIGMGKSTVAAMFARRGVRWVDTDQVARQIVAPGQPALVDIARAFGREVIDDAGQLRRDEVARRVFGDPEKRRTLEAILHPRIRTVWKAQVDTWRTEGHACCLVVIPLLYETRSEEEFSSVVCVACTAETQRTRLQERGWSAEQIRERNAAQWPVESKLALAQFVVWTEGSLDVTQRQVEQLIVGWDAGGRRCPLEADPQEVRPNPEMPALPESNVCES
jgi:dephospho-CoA kinase